MTRKKITFRLARFIHDPIRRLRSYIGRLIHPVYLFPFKLVTYSIYYLSLFLGSSFMRLLAFIFNAIRWPFKGWTNLGKTFFWVGIFAYFAFTELRFSILSEHYGGFFKFLCSEWLTTRFVKSSVVRVIGGLSEGSGFFISDDTILTNFHVIADEPSPKIVFPDGRFAVVTEIKGNKGADLALLKIAEKHPDMVFDFATSENLTPGEPLLSVGYSLGTYLPGEVSVVRGAFNSLRRSKSFPVEYLQVSVSIQEGMSGGPLVDRCGDVVGVNTMSLAGLSLFISADSVQGRWDTYTDQDIAKITVDPSLSAEEAVRAFYTYLKARRMPEGFALLSQEYLKKTDIVEWTTRFTDILDVQIIDVKAQEGSDDTVYVKFSTKNWVDEEAELHYYEGTWQTVFEDGVYKMLKSNIKETENPSWDWFYSI